MYFDISRFPSYGRLGNIDIHAQDDGARVEVNPEKRHPADFAVWKKGDLGWDSIWGKGFPGWHIECSAMAMATLGKQIDIHTGGVDNAPTHHNAEIAQSESATGKQFVHYWIHSEHLNIDGAKIAKSEGNSLFLRDLLTQGFSGADYRYWLLTSHYRTKVDFSLDALTGAKQALYRLKRFMYEECTDSSGIIDDTYRQDFIEAINDDCDTPRAIALIWDLMKDSDVAAKNKRATIFEMDSVLGIGLGLSPKDGAAALGLVDSADIPADVQELLEAREDARAAQSWDEADRLRDALQEKGYTVEDTSEGPKLTQQ